VIDGLNIVRKRSRESHEYLVAVLADIEGPIQSSEAGGSPNQHLKGNFEAAGMSLCFVQQFLTDFLPQ
jgi:hypothetical protein